GSRIFHHRRLSLIHHDKCLFATKSNFQRFSSHRYRLPKVDEYEGSRSMRSKELSEWRRSCQLMQRFILSSRPMRVRVTESLMTRTSEHTAVWGRSKDIWRKIVTGMDDLVWYRAMRMGRAQLLATMNLSGFQELQKSPGGSDCETLRSMELRLNGAFSRQLS